MKTPSRNLMLGGLGAVCLVAGVVLIATSLAAGPPDPTTAEPTELVSYILSESFAGLPAEQRKAYLVRAMKRVSEMTDEQAQQLREMMKEWKKQKPRQLEVAVRTLFKNMMVSEARQYVQVSAEQRDQWLERRIPQWMNMMPKRRPRPQNKNEQKELTEEQKKRRETRRQGKDPRSYEEKVRDFQDNALQLTTAEERGLIMSLMQDAGPTLREHFKKRRAGKSDSSR